jgi:Outer membrane lipoprotein-sorting protein
MRRRVIGLFLPLALLIWGERHVAVSARFGAQTGRLTATDVAKRVQDRDTGRDSRMRMRMKLFDRHGRVRERALEVTGLRGRTAPGAPPTAPDGDRLLMRFTYPNDIRGASFLVWEHPSSEDERFLFLPSLGRVRRIAGAETQDSFVGSDFTYEDIGGREFDDYTYGFSGPDAERASWTPASGGAPRPAWRVESRRKDQSVQFPRAVSLILHDTFVVVQADIYNRRNERQKVYTVRRLEQVDGVWTVMDSEITNSLEKTRTELTVEQADYNVGLKETDFSRRELERGAGRAGGG